MNLQKQEKSMHFGIVKEFQNLNIYNINKPLGPAQKLVKNGPV